MSVNQKAQKTAIFGDVTGEINSLRFKNLQNVGKIALLLIVLNEVRGLIMAAPIAWAMWQAGPTWMQAWLLLCVAVSLVVPVIVWRKCR